MNPDPLDELLRSYSQQPMPKPAEQLPADVWRAIRIRRQQSFWSRLMPILDWREVYAQPRLVAAALAVALVTGILPAFLTVRRTSPRLARESLHFEVFSAVEPALIDRLAIRTETNSNSLLP